MSFKYTIVLVFSLIVGLGFSSHATAQQVELELPELEPEEIVEDIGRTVDDTIEDVGSIVDDIVEEGAEVVDQIVPDLDPLIPPDLDPLIPRELPPPLPPVEPEPEALPSPEPQERPTLIQPRPEATPSARETVTIREVETITEIEIETITEIQQIERTVIVEVDRPIRTTKIIQEFFESIPLWLYIVVALLTGLATWALLKTQILGRLVESTMTKLGYEKTLREQQIEGIIGRQADKRIKAKNK